MLLWNRLKLIWAAVLGRAVLADDASEFESLKKKLRAIRIANTRYTEIEDLRINIKTILDS